jgi:4-amino-4-deoxy-L-arabinose transferase-like glycosyltransferase
MTTDAARGPTTDALRTGSAVAAVHSLSAWRFAILLAAIGLLALTLRGVFPLADPPYVSSPGVVWHDEGAWVHNARNRALTGRWQVDGDRWNPMFITPVLTGLEYLSFRSFGVGLWQARLVSEAMGVLAVLLLGLAVARIGGRRAGLVAAGLLAANFVSVMYSRAAIMEGPMVSLMVASWYCYGRASESPRWGFAAGLVAILAFFTKASAVFFLAALGLDAVLAIAVSKGWIGSSEGPREEGARAAWYTLGGLAGGGLLSLVCFVGPNWQDYRFYNWQMSVIRKPAYTVKAILDRLSWLPVLHDFFTRMWTVTVLAVGSLLGVFYRWRRVAPAERVLVLWLVLGMTELVLHDVGNERRLVFLVPGFVAAASLALARDRRLLDERAAASRLQRAVAVAPVVLGGLYLVIGSAVRLLFLDEVHAGVLRSAVRWSAGLATAAGLTAYLTWPRVPRLLSRVRWSPAVGVAVACVLVGADLWQFSQWAAVRTSKNYEAMVAIGRWLPPGTLVHGKLANGLSLESRITPVFVGRGFGNYEDRTRRPDIRYLLTYVKPKMGYESQARNPVTMEILAACPGWKVVHEFDVAETPSGRDRAALIDKYPDRQ